MSTEQTTNTTPSRFTITETSSAFAKNMAAKQEALEFFKLYPQELTLDNVIDAGIDVFVRNNLSGDRPGRLSVDFTVNGRKVVIPVYNISIAIRLNDYMAASDIRSSGSLRDMLYKKALVLVHPDTAKAEWATPRGTRELERFVSSLAKTANSPETAARVPVKVQTAEPTQEGSVGDRMKSFVVELQAVTSANNVDQDKKQEILDKIFANNRSFSNADVEYFQKETEGDQPAQDVAFELMEKVGSR